MLQICLKPELLQNYTKFHGTDWFCLGKQKLLQSITSNYRQIRHNNWKMFGSSIVEMFMNKIDLALWINVCVDDCTAELAIIASNRKVHFNFHVSVKFRVDSWHYWPNTKDEGKISLQPNTQNSLKSRIIGVLVLVKRVENIAFQKLYERSVLYFRTPQVPADTASH